MGDCRRMQESRATDRIPASESLDEFWDRLAAIQRYSRCVGRDRSIGNDS